MRDEVMAWSTKSRIEKNQMGLARSDLVSAISLFAYERSEEQGKDTIILYMAYLLRSTLLRLSAPHGYHFEAMGACSILNFTIDADCVVVHVCPDKLHILT